MARRLLALLSNAIALYLTAQAHAGAQNPMLFDTRGGALGHAEYRHFSLDPMAQIVEGLRADAVARELPIIVFTKGRGQWLSRISETDEPWAATGPPPLGGLCLVQTVALQGTDLAVLNASPEKIRSAVRDVLEDYEQVLAMSSTWVTALLRGLIPRMSGSGGRCPRIESNPDLSLLVGPRAFSRGQANVVERQSSAVCEMHCPVIYDESSLARKSAILATSSTSPQRPMQTDGMPLGFIRHDLLEHPVRMLPGPMALTRTCLSASATAMTLVS